MNASDESRNSNAAKSEIEQGNAGARIADDCFCPGCGARGHVTHCQSCQRYLNEAGR